MAITNARSAVRGEILKRHPTLGYADTMDGSPAGHTYIDHDFRFVRSTYGPTRFKDYFAYIPGTSVANDVLRLGTTLDVSNGQLSVTGAAYNASTTQTAYELWAIDPLEVNQAIQLAQRQSVQKVLLPLSGGRISSGSGGPHDFDMETSGVAYWDSSSGGSAVSNITPTKSITDLLTGAQSLVLTATGSSGTCRGEKLRCKAGDTFYSAIIARADVGTLGFTWYNVTGSAVFSATAISYTGEDYIVMWRKDVVPTGCEEMQIQFSLTGASDVAIVDCVFGPYQDGQRSFSLPATISDTFEVKSLRPATYGGFAGASAGQLDAYSQEFLGDWQQPIDFEVQPFRRDVSPTRVVLHKPLPQMPVWISLERDLFKAGETLATEAAVSSADLDELVALTMVNLLENNLLPREMNAADAALLAKYRRAVVQEKIARPPLAVVPQRHFIRPVA